MEEHQCSDLQNSQPQHLTFDFSVSLSSVQEAVMLRLISLVLPFKPSLLIVTGTLSRRDSSFAVLLLFDKELESGFVCSVGV